MAGIEGYARIYGLIDIAEMMDVKVVTVRKWIRDGDLQAAKIGKTYRIQRSDLEQFLFKKFGFKPEEIE